MSVLLISKITPRTGTELKFFFLQRANQETNISISTAYDTLYDIVRIQEQPTNEQIRGSETQK